MLIETLAFDVNGMTERQAYNYVESFRLALAEYPGVAAHARMRVPNSNRYVIVGTWESEEALIAFRHSEVYARFIMSPNVETISDHEDAVEQQPERMLLAAA
jgi:heme-degrading monooxygenase HmoA